jgi:DNA-binding NarL/FixJ family response regulator
MKAAPAADVIVTGIALRGRTNGIDLIAQLRRRPETAFTPIVVLSACATTDYTRRATEAGCDIFLSKPCLPDVLLETVRRLVLRPNRRTPAKASLRKPGGAGANDGVRETRAADGKAGPVSKTRPV